ncbi:MAG TPA: ABC transporter permease [Vicinamibacterales bacterium]|nr:ABC transporter permease [Vicinamibacterales bacterium]
MAFLRRLIAGLTALFRRHQLDQELDEELRAYLEESSDEKMRAGMPREDALRLARVQIGSLAAVKDHTRDVGWESRLESLWRDVRYAARRLRRSPAFAVVAVLTLALGIGANTAIFSAVDAIMLRRLPVDRPQELIALRTVYPNGVEPVFSYAAYRTFAADAADLVEAMAASTVRRAAVAIDGPPEPVDHQWVSGNYFSVLGVPAALGRTLLDSDDRRPSPEAVAVLSDACWRRRFGGDPAVVGRRVRLGGTAFTIVGVAPPGFSGESLGEAVDLWMPLTAQPGAPSWVWNGHSTTWLRILARRRPGVTLSQARTGLEQVYARIQNEVASGTDSPEFRAAVLGSRLSVSEASRGASRLRDNLSTPLLILMAIVGLVLLVACANVANLMLARAAASRREIAVSLALGAGRVRLLRQAITEAMLLAAFGGAGGLLLGAWARSVLESMISGALPISLDLALDMRVFAFAALVTCATAFVSGWLPALRATRIDPLGALRSGAGAPGRSSRAPLGRMLVVAQIVVSLVLLVAAGLFVRSLLELHRIETGFDPERVLLFRMTSPADDQPVSPEVRRELYRQFLARARSLTGVEGASASFSGVLARETWGNTIAVEGYAPPPGVTPRTLANAVTPGYFEVLRIAVLRGRGLSDRDHEAAPAVAVVNETFARHFFGEGEAVGRRVAFCSDAACASRKETMQIVGVVEDAKYTDLREDRRPMLYVPFTQIAQNLRELQVRTAGPPGALAATLYRELAAVDRRLAVVAMVEADDQVAASIVAERLVARLSATFGLLALALSGVGLYGLLAYVTTQRTGELGIRMALGADSREVRALVLRDTLRLLGLGLLIGIPAAVASARLVASQLYEVTPDDPAAWVLGVATLSIAALVAGYLPARRAARLDPSAALRAE